jgi:aspartate kinase
MPILVQKYGGSSVASTEKIQHVASRVVAAKERGYDVCVVVSAMGKQTNQLLDLARQINPDPDGRELDMLVTVGERISMALLAMAIQALGHKAISFTGSQSGIITNDSAGAARIIEVRPYRVQDELARGHLVIVAGYQGVSYKREVTTLGRGGSDTTAVALAAALGAEACEIYSDVDGVYSSDPRVVIDAKRLDEITYDEMLELARFGAKVLNAEAIEFARRAGIAVHAKLTAGGGEGTLVRRDGFPDAQLAEERAAFVTGVAGRSDVLWLEVVADAADDALARQLLALVARADLLYSETRREPGRAMVLVSTENVASPDELVASVQRALGERVTVRRGLGLVTAVGSRAGNRTQAQGRFLNALAEAGLPPELTFTSRSAISGVLPAEDVPRAMQVVHTEFLGD